MMVSPRMAIQRDREDTDQQAKELVLDAYRAVCRTEANVAFDAALSSYMSRYPHVSRELAGHAVAHILATAGV